MANGSPACFTTGDLVTTQVFLRGSCRTPQIPLETPRLVTIPKRAEFGRLTSALANPPVLAMSVIEMRVPRDSSFKLFVLNQTFIRHLLQAYPLTGIDLSEVVAIDATSPNFVGPYMRQRVADAVWRLTLANGELVYLLVECQDKVDPTMPFRMLHAVSTLYFALSNNPPKEFGYSASAVPRIKHLTIYSGKRRWTPAGEVGAAISVRCADAEKDIPRMECPLLDLRRCSDPGGNENLAVLLGRLQRCESPEALRLAAAPLKGWSRNAAYALLAGAFASWISEVLVPDLGVPDAMKSDNLDRVLDMLEDETLTWADRMRAEGRQEGLVRERKLLLRQARIRFGESVAGSLAAALERIADTDHLDKVGEWLVVCDSGDALLALVNQS